MGQQAREEREKRPRRVVLAFDLFVDRDASMSHAVAGTLRATMDEVQRRVFAGEVEGDLVIEGEQIGSWSLRAER
jgi:hypothetical protein